MNNSETCDSILKDNLLVRIKRTIISKIISS